MRRLVLPLLLILPLAMPLRAEPAPGRLFEAYGSLALDERLEMEVTGRADPLAFDPGTRGVGGIRMSAVRPGETWGLIIDVGYQSTRAANIDLNLLTGGFGVIWDPWRDGGEGWRRWQPHALATASFASVDGSGEGDAGERAGTLLLNSISSLTEPGLTLAAGLRAPLSRRCWLLAELQYRYLGLAQADDWRSTVPVDPAGRGALSGSYAALGLAWK